MADKVTNSQLKDAILDVRAEVVELKNEFVNFKNDDFANLRQHVNHEVELLRGEIDKKLNATEVLSVMGYRLLANKFVRWAIAVTLISAIAATSGHQWVPLLNKIVQGIPYL